MTKKFTKYIIFFLLLIIIPILYLNYIGINTLKFNSIIEQKFKEYNPRVDINLKKVNILLVIKDLSIRLKTKDPILIVDQTNHVELEEVSTNISISSYLTGEFSLKNLKLITKKNTRATWSRDGQELAGRTITLCRGETDQTGGNDRVEHRALRKK